MKGAILTESQFRESFVLIEKWKLKSCDEDRWRMSKNVSKLKTKIIGVRSIDERITFGNWNYDLSVNSERAFQMCDETTFDKDEIWEGKFAS